MNEQFTLPSFFQEDMDYSLINQVQKHLYQLKLQSNAHYIIKLFDEHPTLKSFSFSLDYETDDEGYQQMYIGAYTVNCDSEEEDIDLSQMEEAVREKIHQTLRDIQDDDLEDFYQVLNSSDLISRSNVHQQLAHAMRGNNYEIWQASIEKAKLEQRVNLVKKTSTSVKL